MVLVGPLYDQIGSIRLITDSAGSTSTATKITYDPYGNVVSTSGSLTSPFGYSGQYTDGESGLIYLRARYYQPSTGSFLTVDPAVAVTRHPYQYAAGNPLRFTDPTGRDLCETSITGCSGSGSSGSPPPPSSGAQFLDVGNGGPLGIAYAEPTGDGQVIWTVQVLDVFKTTNYVYSVFVNGVNAVGPTEATASAYGRNQRSDAVNCQSGDVVMVTIDVAGGSGSTAEAYCFQSETNKQTQPSYQPQPTNNPWGVVDPWLASWQSGCDGLIL